MKRNTTSTLIAVLTLSGTGLANAAVYTNPALETPFDVTLNTGSTAWANESAQLSSSDAPFSYISSNSSNPVFREVITPAQPGVPGSFDVYRDVTSYQYDGRHQQAGVAYSAAVDGSLFVPQSFSLAGEIQAVEPLVDGGWGELSFWMDMDLTFGAPYVADSVFGTLTFQFGSAPGDWTFAFQRNFDSSTASISLGDYRYFNMSAPVYFLATYDIAGASVPFTLDSLNLNVNTYVDQYSTTNLGTTSTLVFHSEIPALPAAVPVPAAVWLLGSGLIGLAAVARRRSGTV